MTTTRKISPHKLAAAIFELRVTLNSAHASLSDDHVIARPLSNQAISQTAYWFDALAAVKVRGCRLLLDAMDATYRVMALVGPRPETELGTLLVAIKEHIEAALSCLSVDTVDNDARIVAAFEANTAASLVASALLVFMVQNPLPASTSDGEANP